MTPLIWGYKYQREIARRMPHFRGEPPMLHPAFAPGGPASIVAHANGPVPFDAPRIVYSAEDERALEAFAHANGARTLIFRISLIHSYCAGDSRYGLALGECPLLQSAVRGC